MIRYPLIEKAPAKINLTLHVGPPTNDGYHPLQSLVVFADIGDVVKMRPAKGSKSKLTIDGPFSKGLETDESNLVLRTAQFLGDDKYDIKLTKNLPIASGIGGGSADAAATARLLNRLNNTLSSKSLVELGADIPVCFSSQTCLMEGKGENLKLLPDLGRLHAVLVNPKVAVSTARVFKLFDETNPSNANLEADYPIGSNLLDMARAGRNDLQDVAISIAPEISTVLHQLDKQDGCQLARMSGSGSTCFGIFMSVETAKAAQSKISIAHPNWWCVRTVLGNKS